MSSFIVGIGICFPNVHAPMTTENLLRVCNLGEDVSAEWIDSKIGAWQRYTATDCPFDPEYHPTPKSKFGGGPTTGAGSAGAAIAAAGAGEAALKPMPHISTYAHPLRARTGCLNSDISAQAVVRAVRDAGLQLSDIDLLIHSTCTPDFPTPPTSTIVQEKAGLKNHMHTMDVRSSCSGPTQSIQACVALLQANPEYKYAVVCGADVGSIFGEIDKDINPENWSKGDVVNTALIGDAAGAFVISRSIPDGSRTPAPMKAQEAGLAAFQAAPRVAYEIVDIVNGSMGVGCDKGMYLPCGGCVNPPSGDAVKKGLNKFSHSFSAVLSHGPRLYLAAVDKMMSRNGITLNDMKLIVPHQANSTVPQLAAKVGVDPNLIYSNFKRVGNTANASLYLCMWDIDRSVPSTDAVNYRQEYNDYHAMLAKDDESATEKLDMQRPSLTEGDLVALVSAESTKWLYGAVLLRVVDPATVKARLLAGEDTSATAKDKRNLVKSNSTMWQRMKLSIALKVAIGGLALRAWWRAGKGKKKGQHQKRSASSRLLIPALSLLCVAAVIGKRSGKW